MDIIQQFNKRNPNRLYNVGDLVRVVKSKSKLIKEGAVCKVIKMYPKKNLECSKPYCNFSSTKQCICIEENPVRRTWTCYAKIERIE